MSDIGDMLHNAARAAELALDAAQRKESSLLKQVEAAEHRAAEYEEAWKKRDSDALSFSSKLTESYQKLEELKDKLQAAEAALPAMREKVEAAERRAGEAEDKVRAFGPLRQLRAYVSSRDDFARPDSVLLGYDDSVIPGGLDSFVILLPPDVALKKEPVKAQNKGKK